MHDKIHYIQSDNGTIIFVLNKLKIKIKLRKLLNFSNV